MDLGTEKGDATCTETVVNEGGACNEWCVLGQLCPPHYSVEYKRE